MLADISPHSLQSGMLATDLHLPGSSLLRLLDFIGDELPRWRDRGDRRAESSETILTSQLCAHLNSAARHAPGWDILQFRAEESDETNKGRKIDLVPAPCGVTIWIDGRRYSDFEALLPIECKRLPTPTGSKRDEREYVTSSLSSTGGIHRFKNALHGSSYSIAAMIAYVQEDTNAVWFERVCAWITALAAAGDQGWADADQLHLKSADSDKRTSILTSRHTRAKGLSEIELRHFWLEMN